jgi:glycosyltransferase involved in cell wall biosynthesis
MTQARQPAVLVVIPARNEADSLGAVLDEVRAHGFRHMMVVDDASTDSTSAVARRAGVPVLSLGIQLGAWGAIQTGLRYAARRGYEIVVTMDGDGQHLAMTINSLIKPLTNGEADVVIGVHPPRVSRARRLAWSYFRLLTGLKFEDLTSGFRAYGPDAIRALSAPVATLLDYQDVGVLLMLRRARFRIREVPTPMRERAVGASRVFSSWYAVGKYLVHTSVLSIACLRLIGPRMGGPLR